MEGGATGGYWAIGNFITATPPTTRINRAITQAKIGRSIKNLAMRCAPYFAADEAADAAGAGWAPAACHGTGLTGALPLSFWKPSTMTCSPVLRPSSTTHCAPLAEPILTGRGVTFPSVPTTITVSPCAVRVTACWGKVMALVA